MGNKDEIHIVGDNWWETERPSVKRARALLQFREPPQTPFQSDEIYTIQQIADLLKISYITVQRWVSRGDLESLAIGRRCHRVLGKKVIEHLGRLRSSI